jgi:Tol biopolymer transport system component
LSERCDGAHTRQEYWAAEVTSMIRFAWLAAGLALVLSAGGASPMAQSRPEVALRAAIELETIKGDLRGAIAQYRTLAASSDRAIAAQALVRMAGCHRKLGDAEARGLYERVVREFADQSEAVAAARAGLRETGDRLAANGTTTRGDRAVWTGPNVDMFGRVSPDGRYVTFVEWEKTGNLALRDLGANTERLLTEYAGAPYSAWAEYSTISSDSSEVLYVWGTGSGETQARELRRLGLNGASPKEPVTVFTAPSELRFFGPLDWSKDKSFVATTMSKRDGTGQIVTIRIADGAVTVLRPVSWRGPDRLFLSPDARYLAYDLRVAETDPRSDVFVMDLASRREVAAVRHAAGDVVLGWSPDGATLLFSSDRTGVQAIWGQRLADGVPVGAPQILKPDGAGLSLGVTPSGTLYVHKIVSSRDVQLADLDLAAGRLLKPRGFDRGFVVRPRVPAWSRDGRRLAYPGGADNNVVVIRDLEAGTTRELASGLLFVRDPRWSPDGSRVLVASRDRQGRNGIFTIDVQSGAVETVVLGPPFSASPLWSADGSKIYYLHNGLIERTLASGAERTLRPGVTRAAIEISPDGQWLALLEAAGGTPVGPGRAFVIPTAGGEARQVFDVKAPDGIGPFRTMAWTADSRALLVIRTTPTGKRLWEVPIDARPARALEIDAEIFTRGAEGMLDQGFTVSPDGRQVAFLSGRTAYEVWAVENLLAALPSR